MTKPKSILNKLYLLLVAFIALTAIIIESCKKDNHAEQKNTVTDLEVAQAKSWYESTYPVNSGKQSTQSTTTSLDFSQHIKPDWNHTATYTRFDDDVIEMPLDATASAKMGLGLKSESGEVYQQDYSRSSFLLIKQLGKYNAYVMTIIAAPAYLKGDLTRLDRNKYNKRDSAFSGVVLYNTPKGKFVNGWFYKNGKISGRITAGSAPAPDETRGGNKTVQSLKTNLIEVCSTWTQTTTFNGSTSEPVYLGTDCTSVSVFGGSGSGGGDSGSNPGNTGGGGSGGSAPNPTPCIPVTNSVSGNGIKTQSTQPQEPPTIGDDGGFPPPTGPVPCTTGSGSTAPISITTPNLV